MILFYLLELRAILQDFSLKDQPCNFPAATLQLITSALVLHRYSPTHLHRIVEPPAPFLDSHSQRPLTSFTSSLTVFISSYLHFSNSTLCSTFITLRSEINFHISNKEAEHAYRLGCCAGAQALACHH